MQKEHDIEIHNDEVREIMKEIPGSVLRWGLGVIFLTFFCIIVGSYFFKYPKVVSAPLIITTENPPAQLISKTSGRISHWFHRDGDFVLPQDPVALINSTSDYDAICKLEKILAQMDASAFISDSTLQLLSEKVGLGDLQEQYNQLARNSKEYKQFLQDDILTTKIKIEETKLKRQQENYEMMLQQKELLEEELQLEEKTFSRYEVMINKGGVSESQIDQAKSQLIQARRNFIGFKQNIKSSETNLLTQQRLLLDLNEQRNSETRQFELNINDNVRSLTNQINSWKDRYLICSPIAGRLTLDKFWSENHVIQAGERLATVVPPDSMKIICKAMVPVTGIGEIRIGQKVNIKLSGFPYMEYGMLLGVVESVSLVPEESEYAAFIRLDNMTSSYSEHLRLIQEMDGTAEIVTDDTRAIYRFIQPLKQIIKQ